MIPFPSYSIETTRFILTGSRFSIDNKIKQEWENVSALTNSLGMLHTLDSSKHCHDEWMHAWLIVNTFIFASKSVPIRWAWWDGAVLAEMRSMTDKTKEYACTSYHCATHVDWGKLWINKLFNDSYTNITSPLNKTKAPFSYGNWIKNNSWIALND